MSQDFVAASYSTAFSNFQFFHMWTSVLCVLFFQSYILYSGEIMMLFFCKSYFKKTRTFALAYLIVGDNSLRPFLFFSFHFETNSLFGSMNFGGDLEIIRMNQF